MRFADAKAIFFDVDDTLYDFKDSMQLAFVHLHRRFPDVLGPHGEDKLANAYWQYYNGYDDAAKRELINRDPALFRRIMWAGALRILGHDEEFCHPDGFASEITAEFMLHRPAHWRSAMFSGAAELLHDLRAAGRTIGAITNGPGPVQRPKVEALDQHGWFPPPLLFISGEFGVYKPDPSIFRAAAKASGFAPEECVMVGDAREYDMPAKAIGFRTILFDGRSQKPDCSRDPYPPDAVVRSYAELRELVI